jgi:hypothetical protein
MLGQGPKNNILLEENPVKKQLFYLSISALVLTMVVGCKDETPKTTAAPQTPTGAVAPAPAAMQGKTGTVVETMNAAGYTYVQVDSGSEKFWAAAPEFQVAVGDSVAVPEGMPMPNYHSKTLDRDFDLVYFVPAIMAGGAGGTMSAAPAGELPSGHPAIDAPKADDIDMTGIVKAEGGKSIEEIFAGKAELTGQPITVRGKVVKFSPEIMGKNWIHLQDGTGGEGANDLTITTSSMAKVGDTVVITGVLTADKDFGHGYQYDLIIEDGQVTAE